ncbi:MAG: biopolymer transporter ExbD [Victivallales bacterium]|nr:biopolymer transporter ExbD [Victivallales bacterium]
MKHRPDDTLETPITSMIDIVFQLIIFFVVTSAIDKDVVDESIKLASAQNAPAVETVDPHSVTINLHSDGEINVAMMPMSLPQLRNFLISMRSQSGNATPILIRCDGTTRYRKIDQVMQVVTEAGLYRVRIVAMLEE